MNNRNKSTKKGNGKSKNSSSQPRNARVQNNNKKNNGMSNGAKRQVSVASAYSSQQLGKSAQVKQGKDSINIVHREFIGNVSGAASSIFTANSVIAVNPGMIETFPWLATIAQNWESYMFKKCRICYFTRTGSTTVGSVIIAPDYDAADSAPSSEQVMTSYADVVEDVPWKDISCNLRASAMHPEGKRKMIRTSALGSNLDIKTYDVANVYVNSVDSAAAASWGKLWIEYEVTLFTPQASSGLPVGISGGRLSGLTAMTGALPFGTGGSFDASAMGLSYSGTTGMITFEKVGTYIMVLNIIGTTISAFPAATLSGATSLTTGSSIDTGGATAKYFLAINVTTSNATCILTATAATVTATGLYVGCAPVSSLT